MKYLRSKEQLNEILNAGKIIIVVFIDPNEFMPAKLLLNYIYSHGATPKIDHMIYIWNQVDQSIYDLYHVVAFPQITVLKAHQPLYSALGYNREKANEAIATLCKEAGLGKLTKQLNKGLSHCPNGHELSLLESNREEIYVGGCF